MDRMGCETGAYLIVSPMAKGHGAPGQRDGDELPNVNLPTVDVGGNNVRACIDLLPDALPGSTARRLLPAGRSNSRGST